MNREAIYSALFNLVKTSTGLITSSRRVKMWTEVPAAEQPALFMSQTGETAEPRTNQPTRWIFRVELYLYAMTTNAHDAPASVLNPILDAVVAKLSPIAGENQTLGGLVHYCRISGPIETDEGHLGDQAVAIIPIEMQVT